MPPRIALGILVVLLAACGSAGSLGSVPSPSPTPTVVLTEADSGRTVDLPLGQVAALRLSSRYIWADPQASGSAVHVTRAGAGEWDLTAVARGTATVKAQGRPACSPSQPCPALIVVFSLTVKVT